jgi:serine/threonine-protein kinase
MTLHSCFHCQQSTTAHARFCPQCGQPFVLRDRYRLQRELARGGFAVVFEAVDLVLRRPVAIKRVASYSPASQEQIAREVDVLSQFASRLPFIPDIYDQWSVADETVLVQEFVPGPTLADLLTRRWTAAQTTRFLRTLLGYLVKLHAAGIIHRDLKPSNIKRTTPNRYVLLDFGIAKQADVTLAFAHAGSIEYAPLEQLRGEATDARSDLFSLAATAYHLLTGTVPVPVPERLAYRTDPTPPSVLVPGVSPTLDALLLQMLMLDPADRPADAKAALQLLRGHDKQSLVAAG